MEPTYFAQYRGFEFQCSPERIGENAFLPRLVIFDVSQAVTLEIPVDVSVSTFSDPTEAARRAFAQGRVWVDSGYDAAAAATNGDDPGLLEY